jgi:hypothetical protein
LSVYILMSFDFPFGRLFEFGNFDITLTFINNFCLLGVTVKLGKKIVLILMSLARI